MIREPGTPSTSPETLQEDDLNERVAAVGALTAHLRLTAAAHIEHQHRAEESTRQFYSERYQADKSLRQTLKAIQEVLDEGNLDNKTAAQMWAEATSSDFPSELFSKIDQIYEGVHIMDGFSFSRTIGTATGEVTLSLESQGVTAVAPIKEGPPIAIYGNTYIGDDSIINFLSQKLEECTNSRNATSDSKLISEAIQAAKKIGLEVPIQLEEATQKMVK